MARKIINLKSNLSKLEGKTVRVKATFAKISRPKSGEIRRVLITDILINGQDYNIDHMWIAWNKNWDDFKKAKYGDQITFKTKVAAIGRELFKKYIFGRVYELQTIEDYNKKEPKIDAKIINPDTKNLLKYLRHSGLGEIKKVKMMISSSTEPDGDNKVILTLNDINYEDTYVGSMEVKTTAYKISKLTLPAIVKADLSLSADIHKIPPYQPVYIRNIKNIKELK
jgi:hypothetical protein